MISGRKLGQNDGYFHLTSADWKNPRHPIFIAASLVKGVYVQERDRRKHQSLAPPWWKFFGFELIRKLEDDVDFTIFGAIYKFNPLGSRYGQSNTQVAPKYIIAIRGNSLKWDSGKRDMKLNSLLIKGKLNQDSRNKIALQAVRDTVSIAGELNVWLAGHSLGSAIAMLAAKNMALEGTFLEAFLFNPPFPSLPFGMIKNKVLKRGFLIADGILTAGLTVAVKGHRNSSPSEDPSVLLSKWVPHLFVNRADPICSRYADHFEHRGTMNKIGFGVIGKLATMNSKVALIKTAIDGKESEPLHLFPSASVHINQKTGTCHGIKQWWEPDLDLQSELYEYK